MTAAEIKAHAAIFADQARDAFRKCRTIEDLSRADAFLEDKRFWALPPETRVTIRAARGTAHTRLMGAARAS